MVVVYSDVTFLVFTHKTFEKSALDTDYIRNKPVWIDPYNLVSNSNIFAEIDSSCGRTVVLLGPESPSSSFRATSLS